MANTFYSLNFESGISTLELTAEGLTDNYTLKFPVNAPDTINSVLRWNQSEGRFNWVPYNPGTSGITSVGLTLGASFNDIASVSNSPLVANGNLGLELDSQTANMVLAAPNGVNGLPLFRTLLNADLPNSIAASKITGVLAPANIPNGTDATSFILNRSATGYGIKNEPTGIKIIATDGTTLGDLFCNNLNVSGSVNQTNVTELNVEDQFINLLAGFTTGVPTLNGGVRLRRGGQPSAQMLWSEGLRLWTIGTEADSKVSTRTVTKNLINSELTSGVYIWNHGLSGIVNPAITVINSASVEVNMKVVHNTLDQCTITFARVGTLVGTWKLVASI